MKSNIIKYLNERIANSYKKSGQHLKYKNKYGKVFGTIFFFNKGDQRRFFSTQSNDFKSLDKSEYSDTEITFFNTGQTNKAWDGQDFIKKISL
ncbi:MAG: hypothetical protein HRT87_09650 [Legionellales bacterium]|nr:hypothetical protein [Legionellales bacterium]